MPESANFMNSSPLSDEDNEKIAHGNAEKLFHIPATGRAGI
jgi:predicted TIM-barrel fold metal-dependent hydrolase